MDEILEIIAAIDAVSSVEDTEQLKALDENIKQFFASRLAPSHLEVWFRLFERFPEDDGYGMFWSILHGLEATPNCEFLVIESVRRRPSRFPVLMLNRMLNAGQTHVGDVDLLMLLKTVTADERCSEGVRRDAKEFVDYQQRKS